MRFWSIEPSERRPLVELRAWTYDEVLGWITCGPRILAVTFNGARALVPTGCRWARTEGDPGNVQREWWAPAAVAA